MPSIQNLFKRVFASQRRQAMLTTGDPENSSELNLQILKDICKTLEVNKQILQDILSVQVTFKDIILQKHTTELQQYHSNPLNKFGKKCFSQTDEDGITLEILKRLDLSSGVFAEFGVGNGLENNTLILLALRWRGFWMGGEELAFRYQPSQNFIYLKDWITLENILVHTKLGLAHLKALSLDVISIDLDGNDIYFVKLLLEKDFRPKLFIVEYNAKFPPPVRFQIKYDAAHQWNGDDYFGASLYSFAEMFSDFGYKLICCNSHTGANAFFVDNRYSRLFADVPDDIDQIYVPPRYHLYNKFGHNISVKVVQEIFDA